MNEKEKKQKLMPGYSLDLGYGIRSFGLKEDYVSDDDTGEKEKRKEDSLGVLKPEEKSSTEENDFPVPENKEKKDDLYLQYVKKMFPELKVISRIGRGGFGHVYKCERKLSEDCTETTAVKVIETSLSDNDREYNRVQKEIECQYRHRNHNAVRIYNTKNAVTDTRRLVMIHMECMHGSLRDLLEEGKQFETVEAVNFGISLCSILADLERTHDKHNDIKPENIMYINENNRILYKLGDFGSARNDNDTMTTGNQGTLRYMLMGKESSDIYSLGLVLMEILGAEIPTLEKKYSNDFDLIGIEPDLAAICRKACHSDENMRFRSASDFERALKNWKRNHKDEVDIYEADVEYLYGRAEELKEDDESADDFSGYSERTIRYFIGAADKKSREAMYQLYQISAGKLAPEHLYSREQALQYLEKSAAEGYAPAMNAMACRMIRETRKVDQEAEDLFRRAAETYFPAQYNLALMIRSGMMKENRMEESKQLLKQAAEGGYEPADRLLKAADNTKGDRNS